MKYMTENIAIPEAKLMEKIKSFKFMYIFKIL